MNATRLVRAIFFPLTETSVLFALVSFCLLSALAAFAGILGVWLALVVIPAVFRYQLLLLEAQARGREPEPPGAEFFDWVHDLWMLFPAVIAVAIGWAAYASHTAAGTPAMLAVLAVAGFAYPAILGVLAITHSPLQSVNPLALYRFVERCGASYGIAPLYLLLIACLVPLTREMHGLVRAFVEMFFVFSLHSVIGAVIAPRGFADDVCIPDAAGPDAEELLDELDKRRNAVLGHAYGFISRDNRQGGFRHIIAGIDNDSDPAAAWAWYFNRMLTWENRQHALFFAQHYVHDALRRGEKVTALKVILRCRMLDEGFKPLAGDLGAAIEAAEQSGNTELAVVLKRG